mgnify:CR=1 FL=1
MTKFTLKKLPETVMRKYDIRGVFGKDLTEEVAYSFARRFGGFLQNKKAKSVAVGYDARLSSPKLRSSLIKGLREQGINVVDIGLCPTPVLSFAHIELQTDAGIMITGSHNPPDHNGFKTTFKREPFFDQDIKSLNKLQPKRVSFSEEGTLKEKSVNSLYAKRVCRGVEKIPPYRIIWDCGHGAAGAILPQVLKLLPGEHTVLYGQVDGTFPAHHPDPTVKENLEDLQRVVLEKKADVGFAFDGDADRLGVVDNNGNIIWVDILLILLGQDILKRHPGATIIGDIKSSDILFNKIKEYGGCPYVAPTGHSIIKKCLKELSALLAGEVSGHIFFIEDYYGFDDGIYSAIRTLGAMSALPGSLNDWYNSLPATYTTPEIRVEYSKDKISLIEDIYKKLKDEETLEIKTLDGLKVSFKDKGWWLLRASNTQDVLVVRCEGRSKKDLQEVVYHLNMMLQSHDISLKF